MQNEVDIGRNLEHGFFQVVSKSEITKQKIAHADPTYLIVEDLHLLAMDDRVQLQLAY